ncbi:MAG: hypothetical protein ABJG78_15040 [Cyclobacteriaceae bacterium]
MSQSKTNISSNKTTIHLLAFGIGGFIAAIVVAFLLFQKYGFFNFSDEEATAKVVAAILILIGSFSTVVATLIGLLFKRSLDNKNLLLQEETIRLQEESEKRLKLDTAIKAVELFKSASGVSKPQESAGALFALVELNQLQFTFTLLLQLWPKDLIENPTAIWVLEKGLNSKDESISIKAASILNLHSHKLHDEGLRHWPPSFTRHIQGIPQRARELLLRALIESLLHADYATWNREVINGDIIFLSNLLRDDPSELIKKSAAAYQSVLLNHLPYGNYIQAADGDRRKLDLLDEIEFYAPSFKGGSQQATELKEKLMSWFDKDRQEAIPKPTD